MARPPLLAPGGDPVAPDAFVVFERAAIEQSIPQRFEAQVRRQPQRLAVQTRHHAWSYAALNRAANRVGRAILAARGPGPEPVALLVGQGAPLVAAILGVLKAGKFYAPLDPADPGKLLADLLRDTRASLVLAESRSHARASALALPGTPVLDVDTCELAGLAGDEDLGLAIAPDARAYIYYTSGSTGRPKGVVDAHRNVLHNVMRYTNTLRIAPDDRLTLLQGPSFSGVVSSLFGALLNGAAVFPFDVGHEGVGAIAPWLRERALTIYHSVPALFRRVAASREALPALRLIRLEGDRASARDLELYHRRFAAHARLVNGLGATECGLIRQFFVDAETSPPGVVPVGYATEDMEVRVIGGDGEPSKAGEIGEIVVGSRYLALGYWYQEDATAGAFAADPLDPGARVYRTGDLGRLRPDGCLEHLGRIDADLRIRGHRVAVADVEAALLELDGVDAAVVARAERAGEPGLVAYVVPNGRPVATVSAIRRRLAEHLPAHAIPEAYVLLDALPLTANGKLDRRALPVPNGRRPELDEPVVAPQSLLEVQLVDLWEEILRVRPIGVRDPFFDLGGDSLLGVEMLHRVEELFGRAFPPSMELANMTIRRLADRIQGDASPRPAPLVTIQPTGHRAPLFFLHGDYLSGGLYCVNLARWLGPDQPFVALAPCGVDGAPTPPSYEAMALRHLEEIRRVRPSGPYRLAGLCNGGLVALEVARLLEADGQDVDHLLIVAAFPIGAGFSWLRRALWGAGALAGVAAARQTELFVSLRAAILRLRASAPSGWPRALLDEARRGRNRLGGIRWWPGAPPTAAVPAEPERLRRRLRAEYLRLDAAYAPRPYAGRVTLLWPVDDPIEAETAAAWWRRVAARVDVEVVPGTHVTCLTLQAKASAETITRRLRGADAPA